MKKITAFLILLFLFVNNSFSQRETENWYFGNNTSINFLNKEPTVINDSKILAARGTSSISDKNGNLLFYTDGVSVYNSSHIKISGKGLESDFVTSQNVIIIPKPNSSSIFYIFTIKSEVIDDGGGPAIGKNSNSKKSANFIPGLYYSTLDMSANSNRGEITERNILILQNVSEKITAVHHKNGKDIWLATHKSDDNDIFFDDFYTILVNDSGVQTPKKSDFGQKFIFDRKGYMKFSPNGEFLSMASNTSGGWVFKFDNENGVINQPRRLGFATGVGDIVRPYGVEFSIDSNKLYFTSKKDDQVDIRLYQFDMSRVFQNNTTSQLFTIVSFRNESKVGALQLAKNGKIYGAVNSGEEFNDSEPFLSVINNPKLNSEREINFQERSINIPGGATRLGLPNFVQSYFRTRILNETGCVNTDELFTIDSYTTIQSAVWDFGDGNTSNQVSPTHQFTAPGKYLVKATITLNNFPLDVEQEIEIFPLPILKANEKIIQCDSGTGDNRFNLTEIEAKIVSKPEDYLFFYFENENIAKIGFPAISDFDNYKNKSNVQTLYTRVINKNGCLDIVPFTIELATVGIGAIKEMFSCGIINSATNKSEGIFNLADKRAQIKSEFGLDNTITISFYNSFNNAQTKREELPDSFESSSTKIYVRADTALGCGGIESFDATVNNQPEITTILDTYTICYNPSVHTSITLNADASNNRFEWKNSTNTTISTNQNFTLTEIGNFSLTVYKIENGIECSFKKDFTVINPEAPTFGTILVNTEDEENNIVEVSINGNSTYEFSLDNINFSGNGTSYTFTNVSPGLRTIYVRDINNCEIPIQTNASVLGFRKYFTPNGDDDNDYWNINGLDSALYKSINIKIFNRFGRVIGAINSFSSKGWDGAFKGKPQQANNYWFTAEILDINDNLIKETGYFSLIRN
ncbi:MAG: T9SS type B sorting domain-containing protein [Polaribacter sp.]